MGSFAIFGMVSDQKKALNLNLNYLKNHNTNKKRIGKVFMTKNFISNLVENKIFSKSC
jgi:hypothetical protein